MWIIFFLSMYTGAQNTNDREHLLLCGWHLNNSDVTSDMQMNLSAATARPLIPKPLKTCETLAEVSHQLHTGKGKDILRPPPVVSFFIVFQSVCAKLHLKDKTLNNKL